MPFFIPSTQEAEAGRWISEFEASLVYRVSSRAARATQRYYTVLKHQESNAKKKKRKEKKRKNPLMIKIVPYISKLESQAQI